MVDDKQPSNRNGTDPQIPILEIKTGIMESLTTIPRWRMPCVWFSVLMVIIASLSTADFLPPWGHKVSIWLVTVLGSIGSILFPGVLYNRKGSNNDSK